MYHTNFGWCPPAQFNPYGWDPRLAPGPSANLSAASGNNNASNAFHHDQQRQQQQQHMQMQMQQQQQHQAFMEQRQREFQRAQRVGWAENRPGRTPCRVDWWSAVAQHITWIDSPGDVDLDADADAPNPQSPLPTPQHQYQQPYGCPAGYTHATANESDEPGGAGLAPAATGDGGLRNGTKEAPRGHSPGTTGGHANMSEPSTTPFLTGNDETRKENSKGGRTTNNSGFTPLHLWAFPPHPHGTAAAAAFPPSLPGGGPVRGVGGGYLRHDHARRQAQPAEEEHDATAGDDVGSPMLLPPHATAAQDPLAHQHRTQPHSYNNSRAADAPSPVRRAEEDQPRDGDSGSDDENCSNSSDEMAGRPLTQCDRNHYYYSFGGPMGMASVVEQNGGGGEKGGGGGAPARAVRGTRLSLFVAADAAGEEDNSDDEKSDGSDVEAPEEGGQLDSSVMPRQRMHSSVPTSTAQAKTAVKGATPKRGRGARAGVSSANGRRPPLARPSTEGARPPAQAGEGRKAVPPSQVRGRDRGRGSDSDKNKASNSKDEDESDSSATASSTSSRSSSFSASGSSSDQETGQSASTFHNMRSRSVVAMPDGLDYSTFGIISSSAFGGEPGVSVSEGNHGTRPGARAASQPRRSPRDAYGSFSVLHGTRRMSTNALHEESGGGDDGTISPERRSGAALADSKDTAETAGQRSRLPSADWARDAASRGLPSGANDGRDGGEEVDGDGNRGKAVGAKDSNGGPAPPPQQRAAGKRSGRPTPDGAFPQRHEDFPFAYSLLNPDRRGPADADAEKKDHQKAAAPCPAPVPHGSTEKEKGKEKKEKDRPRKVLPVLSATIANSAYRARHPEERGSKAPPPSAASNPTATATTATGGTYKAEKAARLDDKSGKKGGGSTTATPTPPPVAAPTAAPQPPEKKPSDAAGEMRLPAVKPPAASARKATAKGTPKTTAGASAGLSLPSHAAAKPEKPGDKGNTTTNSGSGGVKGTSEKAKLPTSAAPAEGSRRSPPPAIANALPNPIGGPPASQSPGQKGSSSGKLVAPVEHATQDAKDTSRSHTVPASATAGDSSTAKKARKQDDARPEATALPWVAGASLLHGRHSSFANDEAKPAQAKDWSMEDEFDCVDANRFASAPPPLAPASSKASTKATTAGRPPTLSCPPPAHDAGHGKRGSASTVTSPSTSPSFVHTPSDLANTPKKLALPKHGERAEEGRRTSSSTAAFLHGNRRSIDGTGSNRVHSPLPHSIGPSGFTNSMYGASALVEYIHSNTMPSPTAAEDPNNSRSNDHHPSSLPSPSTAPSATATVHGAMEKNRVSSPGTATTTGNATHARGGAGASPPMSLAESRRQSVAANGLPDDMDLMDLMFY